ncbi:MAG TPA: prepilin-type N-terminal cleavage/methylation domain-containing protein [Candidatus Omnitrophota bacterium]|nr:prepilin-type N-terminal cleavage/methylation domain-containing protein [Candidatus Omnitrophota bacterium]
MRRAYTLVEMIVVVVIIGIVAGIAVPLMLEVGDAWSLSSRAYDRVTLQAVVITGRMSKEIRLLRDDRSVVTATSSTFTFFDTNNNTITYNATGTTLLRNNDALADNVQSLAFIYYNDTNASLAAPVVGLGNLTDIRRIEVHYSLAAGSNTLYFSLVTRPQNLRSVNGLFKQD